MAAGTYTVTVTASTGPGNTVTALALANVSSVNFRFSQGAVDIYQDQEARMTTYQFSDVATVTTSPSARTMTIST